VKTATGQTYRRLAIGGITPTLFFTNDVICRLGCGVFAIFAFEQKVRLL
jgi:hypothetical protein